MCIGRRVSGSLAIRSRFRVRIANARTFSILASKHRRVQTSETSRLHGRYKRSVKQYPSPTSPGSYADCTPTAQRGRGVHHSPDDRLSSNGFGTPAIRIQEPQFDSIEAREKMRLADLSCPARLSKLRRLLANRIKIAASIRDRIGISGVGSRSGGNLCTPLFSRVLLSQLIPSP